MGRRRNCISVTDSQGDQLFVYEGEIEDRVPIAGIPRTLIRYELESGEQVQFVDDRTFRTLDTGEELVRVERETHK